MNKTIIIYRYGHSDEPTSTIVNDSDLSSELAYLRANGAEILGTPDYNE